MQSRVVPHTGMAGSGLHDGSVAELVELLANRFAETAADADYVVAQEKLHSMDAVLEAKRRRDTTTKKS